MSRPIPPLRLVVPLIGLVVVVLCFAATNIMLLSTQSRNHLRNESEVAYAYSCGYRAGQIGIMTRLPSLFEPSSIERASGQCPEIQTIAVQHGFTNAID